MNEPHLLAFKAGRRAIGLAVFTGLTLECTFVRELSSDAAAATASTRAFVAWALETFLTDAVLVEEPVTGDGSRARELARVIRDEARVVHTSIESLHPKDVLARRDRPARLPRQELRLLARMTWPTLLTRSVNPVALDAAMLGLYRQTTQLF